MPERISSADIEKIASKKQPIDVVNEKVIDDLNGSGGFTSFLSNHPNFRKTVAGVAVALSVGGISPTVNTVSASENPNPIVYEINSLSTKETQTKAEKELLKLKKIALQNIAGGEFMNAEDFNNPLEKLSVGATVVYSSEANKAAEKKLVNKYISKIKKDDVIYCMSGKAYLVRKEACLAYDYKTVYYIDRFYKLDSFNTNDGSTQAACVNYLNGDPKYEVSIDYSQKSLVVTDELKERIKYDAKTGKWSEMAEYKMLGTAEQRIRKSLNKFLEGEASSVANIVGLDAKEVADYCKTGENDKKTFWVASDANGEPAFFVCTSKKYGFNETNLKSIKQAVDRLNEIDPNLVEKMVNRYSMNCLSYDVAAGKLKQRFVEAASSVGSYEYYIEGGVVISNQNHLAFSENDEIYHRIAYSYNIFVEARALYLQQHLDENLNPQVSDAYWNKPGIINEEADKYACAIAFIKDGFSKKILTKREYDYWYSNAASSLDAYDPSANAAKGWLNTPTSSSDFIPEK